MSSQIALVATEPVRTPTERARRSDVVNRAGGQQVAEQITPPAGKTPDLVATKAPELRVAVDTVREFVADMQRDLQFTVDENSGRTIITVIDSESGKIVRQIPSEELLQIAETVASGGSINLIDSRA
ncbi:MAG: flagellar protein FlaG [Gammaproteobacteria bacterium]|nr:flagellar protein FlaG [Gammaproteobacteria bacterium]MDH3768331.1 flagellar protein FlaG [Gammaproteobacteria bacterium]